MESVRIIEYGPSPGKVVAVTVTTTSQHLSLDAMPELKAAVLASKPLMLSADHQCVLYTWSPTTTSMTVSEGATAASLTSSTQIGAMVFGSQRTPVPETAPRDSAGLVVKAPSGPSVLRIWWGQ